MTKGIDSVRSPVRNLQNFSPHIDHADFVKAVSEAFRDFYGGSGKVAFNVSILSSADSTLISFVQLIRCRKFVKPIMRRTTLLPKGKKNYRSALQRPSVESVYLGWLTGPYFDLQSWEWSHGQTPEFTHELKHSFPWGNVVRRVQLAPVDSSDN